MSKRKINWLITDQNITVNYDGQTHIVSRADNLSNRLIEAIKTGNLEEIPNLVSAAVRIEKFSHGNFIVQDGQILVNGIPAPTVLGNKIIKFSNEGLPFEPLVKFAENLHDNPSYRSVNELFQFLEKNDHPITETGCFIAYKRVRKDLKDIYTGTFDNSVGNTVEMPRNQVNEDPNVTCSHGLHVANWDYAHNIYSHVENDIMLEVEVNPADVVAVPIDYNQSKMRVSKYKVIGIVDQEHSSEVQLRIVNPKFQGETYENFMDDELDCCEYCGLSDCFEECLNEDDKYPWEDELL